MAAFTQRHGWRWPPDLPHPCWGGDDQLRPGPVRNSGLLYSAATFFDKCGASPLAMKTFVHRQLPPAPNVGPRVPPASICVHLRPSAVSPRSIRAFSLVEILVTMALLSVIVLGLLAMFHQTQRAFTQSLMQVDVLEAGRAATDLISHEVEQMTPAYASNGINFFAALAPRAVAI